MSASAFNPLMEEWKVAREVLKVFDDRIHELRKYGFTLITALLAIQGFLLPYLPSGFPTTSVTITETYNATNNGTDKELVTIENATKVDTPAATPTGGLPYEVKIAILGVTAVLVIVLRRLDGHYQGFQKGAALRAKVIERFLNLELTEAIALRYNTNGLGRQVANLYYGFEAATVLLAIFLSPFILHMSDDYGTRVYVAMLLGLVVFLISEACYYYLRRVRKAVRGMVPTDWALDKTQCKAGDDVRIMMTNVSSKKTRYLEEGRLIWDVKYPSGESVFKQKGDEKPSQDSQERPQHPGIMPRSVMVAPDRSYVWSFKIDKSLKPGTYHIHVDIDDFGKKLLKDFPVKSFSIEENGGRELDRRIQVVESEPNKPSTNTIVVAPTFWPI